MTLSVPTVRSSDRIYCPPRMVGNLGNSMTLLRKPLLAARRSLFLGLGILALLAGGAPGQAAAQQDLFRPAAVVNDDRSEEHTSELQSLMRISYAVFCLKKKNKKTHDTRQTS